jgi:hypothetical protein
MPSFKEWRLHTLFTLEGVAGFHVLHTFDVIDPFIVTGSSLAFFLNEAESIHA